MLLKSSKALSKGSASWLKPAAFVLGIGIVTWLVSHFFIQLMLIQGNSMEPTYHNHQFVWINKQERIPDYGDVIAFRCEAVRGVLVKRVVAKPGDTVSIQDGTLYVNGTPSVVLGMEQKLTKVGDRTGDIVLPDGEYYVVGDNLEVSKDSRYQQIGNVSEDAILGFVFP